MLNIAGELSEEMSMEIKAGYYRHFRNGKLYQVIGSARHSETYEEMVIYRAMYHSEKFGDQQVWVRPKQMFEEAVEFEGKMVPRFAFAATSKLV